MTRNQGGRPRDAATDGQVIEAVLDLLVEGATLEGLSFVAVAARAGVSRNTVYRRWATKEALLLDVMAFVNPRLPEPVADCAGGARADLVALISGLFERGKDPRATRVMRCMTAEAERFPQLHALYDTTLVEPRRQALRDAVQRGIDEGVFSPDLDLDMSAAMLVGPPLFYSIAKPDGLPIVGTAEELAERLVAQLVSGLAPR
jgi:AcrR family transcriptional regulator